MEFYIERFIPKLRIHCKFKGDLIASRGYEIYRSKDLGKNWEFLNALPINRYKNLISRHLFARRLLRTNISIIKVIDNNNVLIGCDRELFLSDLNFSTFHSMNIPIRSFQFLRNSICISPKYVYYGEYFPNLFGDNVLIYRSENGVYWNAVYSFEKNAIRHIHLIQYDKFSNRIWFSSGDKDKECILGNCNYDFSDIKIIGKGELKWRCLDLFFSNRNVYWGTDNPSGKNYLISYNRYSKQIRKLSEFPGPIYHLIKFEQGFLIITQTERGKGELSHNSHLWFSRNLGDEWIECLSYKKDWLPNIFGFGFLHFGAACKDKVFLSGSGLNGVDDKSLVLKFEN